MIFFRKKGKYFKALAKVSNNVGYECWDSRKTLSNIARQNKLPVQLGAKFEKKMALTRKPKALVAFMVLELFEDTNDGVKRGNFQLQNPSKLGSSWYLFSLSDTLALHQQPRGPLRPPSLLQKTREALV